MNATRGRLEASTLRPLSGIGGSKKRKITEGGRDVTDSALLEQAPGPSSTLPRGCVGGLAKARLHEF
jgi:hypothetical protein